MKFESSIFNGLKVWPGLKFLSTQKKPTRTVGYDISSPHIGRSSLKSETTLITELKVHIEQDTHL